MDPNEADETGTTPLMYAVRGGEIESVEMLLNTGVDINAQKTSGTFKGYSALLYAVEYGYTGIAEILLERGADIEAGVTSEGVYEGHTSSPLTLDLKSNRYSSYIYVNKTYSFLRIINFIVGEKIMTKQTTLVSIIALLVFSLIVACANTRQDIKADNTTNQTLNNEQATAAGEIFSIEEYMEFTSIIYNGDKFIIAGTYEDTYENPSNAFEKRNFLIESSEGQKYYEIEIDETLPILNMAANGDTIIISGYSFQLNENPPHNLLNMMMISHDAGATWQGVPGIYPEYREDTADGFLSDMTVVSDLSIINNLFYASGANGDVYYSSDGISWENTGIDNLRSAGITTCNEKAVIFGQDDSFSAAILIGEENSWRETNINGPNTTITAIKYFNDQYYAFGWSSAGDVDTYSNLMFISNDGISWEAVRHMNDNSTSPAKLFQTENGFVGISSGHYLIYGQQIEDMQIALPDNNCLHSVAYGKGLFVAGGSLGNLYTSSDGINWTKVE